ncbi:L-2-amino-thiazoline-4-carboxylic acid hydrolase [Bacteroidota bacterium]
MKNIIDRRKFLMEIVPCCALTCFGFRNLQASTINKEFSYAQQDNHKFQNEIDKALTYKQWAQNRHMKYIGILKHLQKDIGKQKLLESIEKASYAENIALGKRLSNRITDMNTFAVPFREENSGVGRTIVREIIEDNDKVFEMKITQCLTEEVFRENEACDLGYACVCHADFGLTEGMDLNIKLTRDKTLMQGHDCCNHRYTLNT